MSSESATQATTLPVQTTQAPETTEATQPQQTVQPTTQPTEMTQPETEPAAETKPKKNSTSPKPTEPPTQPTAEPFDAEQVIASATDRAGKAIPEIKYSKGFDNGTSGTLYVSADQDNSGVSGGLRDELLDLFDYDAYLKWKEDPDNVPGKTFDYTYSVSYIGLSEDGAKHLFAVCYHLEKQESAEQTLDSGAAIRQAVQAVCSSAEVDLEYSADGGYEKTYTIDDVPFFYTTEQCAQYLTETVVDIAFSENLIEIKYTMFKLEYHSKSETTYTFILYLK